MAKIGEFSSGERFYVYGIARQYNIMLTLWDVGLCNPHPTFRMVHWHACGMRVAESNSLSS